MYPIRKKVADISLQIYEKGLVPGKSGNISVKYDNILAITPGGVSLKLVREEDVALLDKDGKMLISGKKPSSELELHKSIYSIREDVTAVVHTHSPYASGFSHAEEKIKRLEGFGSVDTPFLAMVEYAHPGSVQLAHLVSKTLEKEDVAILKGHGVVSVGKTLEEAVLLSEWVENTAKTMFIANVLKK
jgi:L-fuculose-phosphate aldolase